MAVALIRRPAIDLGQAVQPLDLEQLGRPLKLGEVLLDARIGRVRQDFAPQPLHSPIADRSLRPLLEHMFES